MIPLFLFFISELMLYSILRALSIQSDPYQDFREEKLPPFHDKNSTQQQIQHTSFSFSISLPFGQGAVDISLPITLSA